MTYGAEQILRKIQELRESIQARERDIGRMRDELEHLEKTHAIMTEAPSNERQTDIVGSQRFRSMGLQDACLVVLNEAQRPLLREDVSEALLSGGYVTKSNRFRDVVGTTLNNLYKAERIARIETEDRVAYSRRNSANPMEESTTTPQ